MDLLHQLGEFIASSKFLNSNFVTAFIGALVGAGAGAWAGAWAAQRIASRAKLKDQLVDEARKTNAGISLAIRVWNRCLDVKAQLVLPMKTAFDEQFAEYENIRDARLRGENSGLVYQFRADFQTLDRVLLPVETLERIVIEDITILGRPHQLASQLVMVADSLNKSIADRNNVIEELRANNYSGERVTEIYFGVFDDAGHVDMRYPHAVEAISRFTDDCIFFSDLLVKDLLEHGKNVSRQYSERFSGDLSIYRSLRINPEAAERLIPSADNYLAWIDNFHTLPKELTPRERVRRWLKVKGTKFLRWTRRR